MKFFEFVPVGRKLFFILTLSVLGACTQGESVSTMSTVPFTNPQWIDLSYAFDSSTLYWPNNPDGFQHRVDAEGVTDLGYYYSYTILTPEHGGTHLDTPSLDYGQSKDFAAHQALMGNQIPGFENVANLDLLPAKGIYVIALPMKIKGGSGGPLRIIATIKE